MDWFGSNGIIIPQNLLKIFEIQQFKLFNQLFNQFWHIIFNKMFNKRKLKIDIHTDELV